MSENYQRLPAWFKVKSPGGKTYLNVKNLLSQGELHTVCEEAKCPNIGECWDRRSATFMILGDVCTRRCHYCAVTTGRPYKLDMEEPERLARTVERLRLKYCVITSVNRDDLPDGGAFMFAKCIQEIRERVKNCKLEVLIPDFQGFLPALSTVVRAKPEVLNHNIETVRGIFHKVRPKGDYDQSLRLLSEVKNLDPAIVTKSGIMIGLGETKLEIQTTMKDLRDVDCDILTIGQYLRPSSRHFPIDRFYTPEEFDELRDIGISLGFKNVAAGPLVRSSYRAEEQVAHAL